MHSDLLYSVAQVRAIEQAALSALPANTLMQRAGRAVADAALRLLPPSNKHKVLIAAGPGNNGGDALEAAALLAQAGLKVFVVLLADPAALPADAKTAFARARASSAEFIDLQTVFNVPDWALVIDGLFGIGLTRPLEAVYRQLVEQINALPCPVLAIDVPSGLNADTGCIIGPDGVAIVASNTITFIANKPGLHTASGRDCAGVVEVNTLEIGAVLYGAPCAELNRLALFVAAAKPRAHASHKGSYGDVAIVGGAEGMAGAVILAARMAAYAGAGRVYGGFVGPAVAYDSLQPELMCRAADAVNMTHGVLVMGPGMGTARAAYDLLSKALGSAQALVLDADALNLLAAEPSLQAKLAARRAPVLLTPHPLEAARLLACSADDVQSDRRHAAATLAKKMNAIVILKGSGSVIAHPDGRLVINSTGNPALATAGSGDVLAGLCGALLAQHWPVWESALAAPFIHGAAADQLVAQGVGPIGLTAGELLPVIRSGLNRLAT